MKYHYKQGIIEKDKKGHRKLWFSLLVFVGLFAYGGFAFATLALSGWPIDSYDHTARVVKMTKPGTMGDTLFIPAINVAVPVGSSLQQKGTPDKSTVVLSGKQLSIGITPSALRKASPYFNLDHLRETDQLFFDYKGTRYAYRVTKSPRAGDEVLVLKSSDVTIKAVAIGKVAWQSGKSIIQSL